MTKEQSMVLKFNRKFGLPGPGGLRGLSRKETEFRTRFLREEVEEFAAAAADSDLAEMIDALCDIIYVAHGTALYMGVDLEPYFDEVHRTNMLKVGGATRADGKILKPAGWKSPDIAGLIERLER